jgi:hypothetical protein
MCGRVAAARSEGPVVEQFDEGDSGAGVGEAQAVAEEVDSFEE